MGGDAGVPVDQVHGVRAHRLGHTLDLRQEVVERTSVDRPRRIYRNHDVADLLADEGRHIDVLTDEAAVDATP